jgi:serine/threonine protein kinase
MTKSPTAEDFFRLLRESKLVSDQSLSGVQRLVEPGVTTSSLTAALVKRGLLTSWQAQSLLAGRTCFTIGKYQLLDLIAENDRHLVYLGAHRQMERRVDICVARAADDHSAATREFIAQARKLADVNHPHLAHVFDFDEDAGRCYLVMEHVDGDPLVQWSEQKGRQHPHELVRIILQVASAVAYMQRQGIHHGELEASRILVDQSGNAKICGLWESCRSRGDENRSISDSASFGKLLASLLEHKPPFHQKDSRELQELADALTHVKGPTLDMNQVVVQLRQLLDRMSLDERAGVSTASVAAPKSGAEPPRDRHPWLSNNVLIFAGALGMVVLALAGLSRSRRSESVPSNILTTQKTTADRQPISRTREKRGSRRSSTRKTRQQSGNDRLDLAGAGLNRSQTSESTDERSEAPDERAEATGEQAEVPDEPSSVASNDSSRGPGEKTATLESQPVESVAKDESPTERPPVRDPPAAKPNPFTELPTAVNLPVIVRNSSAQLSLGKLPSSNGADVRLDVVGSETSHRAGFDFRASPSESKAGWTIHLGNANRDDSAQPIADVWVEGDELVFQWLPEIEQPTVARHLANCQLRLRSGDFQHLIWMRQGISEADPITITCPSSQMRIKVPLNVPPRPAALQFELIELGPELDGAEIDPPGQVTAGSGPVRLRVGEKKRRPIEFEFAIDTRRTIAVIVTPRFLSPLTKEWLAMTADNYTRVTQEIVLAKRSLPQLERRFDALKTSLQESGRVPDQQIRDLSADHRAKVRHIESAFDDLRSLSDVVNRLQGARVRFRLSYRIGDASIDLVRSREF